MYINGKKILSVVKVERITDIETSTLTVNHKETITVDTSNLVLFRATLNQINTMEDAQNYTVYLSGYDDNETAVFEFEANIEDLKNGSLTIYKDIAILHSADYMFGITRLSVMPSYIEFYYEYNGELGGSSDNIIFSLEVL